MESMADILWNVGEKTQVTVVVPGEMPHIQHSHTYFQDSVTEKVSAIYIIPILFIKTFEHFS